MCPAAAHGSKQLRTPERSSHQQRMMTQQTPQRYSPLPEKQHVGARGTNGSSHHHNGRPVGSQQQQKQQQAPACSNGSSLVNISATSNIAAAAALACGDPTRPLSAAQQQHQQVLFRQQSIDGCVPVQPQAQLQGGNGHPGSDVSQLLQSLAAEASASKQEAEQHSRAAALAQQKLQLLEQLLGGSLQNGDAGAAAFAGAAAAAGMGSMCGSTPMASPVSGVWPQQQQQQHHLLPPAVQLLHLQQQMAAHGAFDSQYPRRHSLDEAFLRRARNLPGIGVSNLGNRAGAGMWGASPSAPLPNLTAVTEGVVLEVPPPTSSSSAAADIEALAAAFAAAGMPMEGQAVLSNMQGASSMQQSACGSMLGPAASAAMAAAQLSGGNSGSWMLPQQQVLEPCCGGWAQGMGGAGGWAQGLAAPAPMGAFHSASQLPAMSYNPAALFAGGISAPQLQSDYLLQLHAALQAGGITGVPRHERASFDVAATYLPPLPGRVGGGGAAADVLAGADDGAATPNSGGVHRSSGCSNVQDAPVLSIVSEKLASNPIGGAGQLGWF